MIGYWEGYGYTKKQADELSALMIGQDRLNISTKIACQYVGRCLEFRDFPSIRLIAYEAVKQDGVPGAREFWNWAHQCLSAAGQGGTIPLSKETQNAEKEYLRLAEQDGQLTESSVHVEKA